MPRLRSRCHADGSTVQDVYRDNQYLQKHTPKANGIGNDALGKQNAALRHGGVDCTFHAC